VGSGRAVGSLTGMGLVACGGGGAEAGSCVAGPAKGLGSGRGPTGWKMGGALPEHVWAGGGGGLAWALALTAGLS
jgi:hypothetical protein